MNTILITVLFLTAYYGISIFLCRGVKLQTKELCLCGLSVALTLVLECIYVPLPTSASLPCASMVPLMLLAILCDYRLAFLSGWVCGVLSMLLVPGWQPVHWGQFFVEHMVCFSSMGFTGVFGTDKRRKILCGILLGSTVKLLGHILSGVIFFSQNAWDGWSAWGYSAAYNISQNVPLCILSAVIVLAMPLQMLKRAIRKENTL